MSARKHTLAECNARFVRYDGREPGAEHGPADALQFECPEGHTYDGSTGIAHRDMLVDANTVRCMHTIPITPALDGSERKSPQQNGAIWKRTGDTIETLTITPSVRCRSHICSFHGEIKGGRISFCGDSK